MKKLILIITIMVTPVAIAAPEPLVIDEKQSPKSMNYQIIAAHGMIPNRQSAIKTRAIILSAMLATRGRAWLLEEEGEGYIRARFDYRGHMILIDIEYNDNYIQLKYVDGFNAFECKNNVNGICYKNHRHYYNYMKRLRNTIANRL